MTQTQIALFKGKKIRRVWDKDEEKWYFSVVDVVGILSSSVDSRKYWNKLAERLRKEGSEVVTKCHRLKLKAADGKKTETFNCFQSKLPTKKAQEPAIMAS